MELTDEELIRKYREGGDIDLFKVLVRRYQTRAFALAYRLIGNAEEAEEIVQDCFIKVHQNLDKYRAQTSFAPWIARICQNLCMDAIRMKQRRRDDEVLSFDPQAYGSDDECGSGAGRTVSQVADSGPSPSQVLDNQEESRLLEESIRLLPDNQRVVLVLHDIQGFSYQQIAEIVGTSIGTVRSRLHYGRMKMKEMLDPYYSEHGCQPVKSR